MAQPSKDTNQRIDAFLAHARTSLTNGRDVPEAQAILGPLGYDAKKLGEGLALLDEAVAAVGDQVREYGEQYAATATAGQLLRAWSKAYVAHLELARLRFGASPRAAILGLRGDRRQDAAGLLQQGRGFYEGVRDDAEFAAGMAAWKVTPGVVAAALAAIEGVEAAQVAQAKESGEAEVATAERDEDVQDVQDFLVVYEGLARIVLADEPQLMETLDLRERGS